MPFGLSMYYECVFSELQLDSMQGFLYNKIQQMKEDEIRAELGILHCIPPYCVATTITDSYFLFTPVIFLLSAVSCAGLQQTIPWENA